MVIIILICFLTLTLTIWLKTDAIVEYSKLLPLLPVPYMASYIEIEYPGTYPEFLKEYHNSFLSRLVACPICLATWFGILSSIFVGWAFPIVSVFGLFFYLLISKLL